MTTYNTRNPVPSADARDRFDNSQVFDDLLTGAAPKVLDRMGVERQSWAGMETAFAEFLAASGFESVHLTYVNGTPLTVDRPTQLIDRAGSVYRVKMPSAFPVTLSGTWATDQGLLVDVGDASLRQDLANPSLGASLVAGAVRYVSNLAAGRLLPSTGVDAFYALGHTNPGDGGAGWFYKRGSDITSDDDNFLIVVGTGSTRYYRDVPGGVVTPQMAGAFPIGSAAPTANASSHIQKLFDSPYDINGKSGVFNVVQVFCRRDNVVAYNLYGKSIGWQGAAGPQSDQSVFTIDGTAGPRRNYWFGRVGWDGSRELFDNITLSGGEDGKLHAWRIVGDVQQIHGERCYGIKAGSAGIVLHHPTPSTTAVEYKLQNITFVDSRFTDNREHGLFADSCKNIKFIRPDFKRNGIDIDPGQPIASGLRGATVFSAAKDRYFGGPFDFEGYAVGSGLQDILIEDADCRGCAVGALFVDDTPSNAIGFVPRSGIKIRGGQYDQGIATDYLNPNGKFPITIQGNYVSGARPFSDVTIEGARMSGYPWFRGVSKLGVSGGFINAATFCGFVFSCDYWSITAPCLNNKVDLGGQVIPSNLNFTKIAGAGGAALTATQALPGCTPDGGYLNETTGTITGAVVAGGVLKFTVGSPSGFLLSDLTVSARSTTGVVSVFRTINAGIGEVWFTPPDDTISFSLLAQVSPRLG